MSKQINTKPFYNSTIPDDWEVKELRDVVGFLDGSRKPIKDSDRNKMKGPYPYYGASGIIDFVNDYIFDEELILLGEDGANIISRSSPLAFRVSGKIWVNNHAHVLKPKNGYEIGYITEFLESIRYDKYNTGTAQPKLNKEICGGIPIILPPLPEQKAIAGLLHLMDTAINKNNLLIEKKLMQKKWLMQMLLTGKKRLKGFSGKWKEKHFGEVADIDKLSLGNQTPAGYSFQYLSLSDVDTGTAQIKSERIIFKEAPSRARRIVSEGDVLLATVRPNLQGFLIVRDEVKDLIASTGFAVITCTKIHNEFLYQYLFTRKLMKQIEAVLTGSNYPAINSSDVKHLKIPYPSLEEQSAISNVLQSADKEIQLLRQKNEKLREEKKGLMQVLLTGKKRLNQDFQDDRISRIGHENNPHSPDNFENPVNSDSDNNLENPKIS